MHRRQPQQIDIMSNMRVRNPNSSNLKSVNLRDFLKYHGHTLTPPTTFRNTSETQTYKKVRTTGDPLGEGSTGRAYKAYYDDGREFIKCVVKLPLRLLKSKQIQLSHKGNIAIVNKGKEGEEYKEACENLDDEWNNFLALHFGKTMRESGMGNQHWSVSDEALKSIVDEMNELKATNGYNHIHRILVSDPEVPLLISEHFDGTVEEFSMMLETFGNETQTNQIFECIIPQTLAGLHFMHSKNVALAHMDIKPENMLYKFVNGEPHPLVVLCDFGICQASERPSNQHFCGTPFFMAPEIKKRDSLYIPKYTDVYSWALSMLSIIYPDAINKADGSLVDELKQQMRQKGHKKLEMVQQNVFNLILDIIDAEIPKNRYEKFTNIYKIYNSH